ncbi:MAG TPA: hypothetical protein VE591_03235 [Candidatus Acidoferrum sp.]|nr:hypothetical protein [Candidatus Acidoferrum sp.]
MTAMNAERRRLAAHNERNAHWLRWGPYLAERQWGTVREDYSSGGSAWDEFPHDHARSRAYRWGEDGIAGISDNHQRLCLALALWNGRDPILKERLFGLAGPEGNHGEDVKEYYFYLDNVPSHAYMRMLYKYPQAAFPYADLAAENRRRDRNAPEYELIDTGVFAENRYFDVSVEYAKADPQDVLMRVTVHNRGPETATIDVMPTLWFRNTWSWTPNSTKPNLHRQRDEGTTAIVAAEHTLLGARWLYADAPNEVLFTENETNFERLYGGTNGSPYVKDGIDAYVVHGRRDAVNPAQTGTKAAVRWRLSIPAGGSASVRIRLADREHLADPFGESFEGAFTQRMLEAEQFYEELTPYPLDDDARSVQRQAFAGLLWSKQWYHYVVRDWLDGDPAGPPPPEGHRNGRNHDWRHLYSDEILSMPDTWEYPWFAAWDLAFHVIPLALVDASFAKRQLLQLTREWFMHPNGQLPAYEWAFDDVNPPVHAWAAYRVYKIDAKMNGKADLLFLERVFQKLLLNFTWWVNRKDRSGRNVFQGGFLGLDNIGIFDRSQPLPTGGHIDQSDGTSWMGVYALNMLAIALELAQHNNAYEDIASKFFEHFLRIAAAMNDFEGRGLWHEEDGFYYDVLHLPDDRKVPMRLRSLVGLIPLLAIEVLEPETLEALPDFTRRLEWFIDNRPDLKAAVACMRTEGLAERRMLAIVGTDRLRRVLRTMLDPDEFLGEHGIRAISRYHRDHSYGMTVDGVEHRVSYEPAESSSGLFGGNSNWRGPVWFPINYLLVEALQKYHYYLGDDFRIALPDGREGTLWDAATEISHRLISTFTRDADGRRPVFGGNETFQKEPHWCDYPLFYEYFHGDNGAGIGASHQTGWTGLVAKLLQQCAEYCGTGTSPLAREHAKRHEPRPQGLVSGGAR